ncbi:MAG: hypothetical protein LC749_08830 [Actinobacteria bacterium]|nr:hypothetical protein [Actinomycetota bacterium]
MASRGNKFGGALLAGVPQPLADDEEEQIVASRAPEATQAASAPAEPAMEEQHQREDDAVIVDIRDEEPASATEQPEDANPRPTARPKAEKQAPGTIRLNEQAGRSLWDSYLEAKTDDPFLSYRQFASAVVLDGLASRQRRHRR